MSMFYAILHIAFALAFAPFLLGVINRTKALFAGRQGQPLLQLYYDLARLLRKGSVFSTTTTWVFKAGPVVGLVGVFVGLLIVPIAGVKAPLAFSGDLFVLAYVLGLARFFTVAAALDTGSAFEGMGGVREVTFASLAEPAFLLGLMVVATASGSMSLSTALGETLGPLWRTEGASLVLVLVSLFVVLLVENCRVPFDDPNTHLELTMIHEVMVLDHSGPAFGMILYGAALKLFLFSAVIIRILVPVDTGIPLVNLGIFGVGLVVLAIGVGVVESTIARLRLLQIPNLLVGACILASFGIVLLAR